MTFFLVLPFAAAGASLLLAVARLLRKTPSPAGWFFVAGMAALGIDSLLVGLSLRSTQPEEFVRWLTRAFIVTSCVPVIWLGFSLTYSRGDYRTFLMRWRIPLAIAGLLPLVSLGFREQLLQVVPLATPGDGWQLQFGVLGKVLNVGVLVALVLILANLEQTLRSAVGTMRWRIKFVILAMAVIFGARFYVTSQAILFSAPNLALSGVESGALLVGCLLLALAYARTGWAEIDVYPSLAVLRSSVTLFLVGGYLFVVGILAQVARRFGGADSFQFQAFVVLLGMTGLAVLLLSDRLRQGTHALVVRHFRRARHDSARIWSEVSRRLANVKDAAGLCAASVRFVSETFDVLSATIWLLDEQKARLSVGASTAPRSGETAGGHPPAAATGAVAAALRGRSSPFDLEQVNEAWAEELRQLNPAAFPNGGSRWCVPLNAGDRSLGALVLADRVNGAAYTIEELGLLACIGDQITSVLLNLRLANEVVQARELEAFRTMSAFFVHDLKNAAASLNLTLKNLPVHFDNPAFREDALRGVGNTAQRIDEIIARLSALRQKPAFEPVEADLNELVAGTLDRLGPMPGVELLRELRPVPAILADREQIGSVVSNLVLNARDAVSRNGRIDVTTERSDGCVLLSVADNGCGMTREFVDESLFRPFQSTKKHGLGIGMFQTRRIIEAHGGSIQVESEAGAGTTCRVSLPVAHVES